MTKENFTSFGEMKRREFLALCALGTLPNALAACASPAVTGNATPTRQSSPTPKPSPTPRPTLTEADWTALARSLQGTLVRPGNPQYPTALQLFSTRFDNVHPAGIAYCASPADVQNCLAFVRRFALPFATRSGGHSYAGYSTTTGLVIDVTRMHTVTVNANAGTATIGSGTRLIDVYSALAQQGLVLPAGSCSTVGIAGLTLGGGDGVLSRKFGLTCDNLLSAQVVVADGRVLTCDANHNADLFWALRGGGGGNFGIVTSFTFQVHVEVNGVYVGDVSALIPLLNQLTGKINATPASRYVTNSTILDTMLYEAGCYNKTVAQCHLPSQNPSGQLQRDTSAVKSDYFTSILPRQGINNLVDAITRRQSDPNLGNGGIGMDSYGGAINRVAADATAFAHRNAVFSAQYSASWNASDPASVVAANHTWQTNAWQSMRKYASGGAYQNYVDPDLPDWQHAYYGSNLPRLQRVKSTYDPGNLFHFAQSIPLAS